MMNDIEKLLKSCPSGEKEVSRAALRVQVSERLLALMKDQGISKADLAKKTGVSRSAVTQALNSSRNMSLNLLADIAAALGMTASLDLQPKAVASHGTAKGHTLLVALTKSTGPIVVGRKGSVVSTLNHVTNDVIRSSSQNFQTA